MESALKMHSPFPENSVKCPLCQKLTIVKKYSYENELISSLVLPKNYSLICVLEELKKGKIVTVKNNPANSCYEIFDQQTKKIMDENKKILANT